MKERIDSETEFYLMKRARSFVHAGRGVVLFLKTTPNSWIHLFVFGVALGAGYLFGITKTEFLFIILASAIVLITEAVNTAIEIDINLTSPDHHPYARDTKDVAAAAVLIASIFALIIGLIVFVPYLL